MITRPIIFNYYTYGTPYFGSYYGMRYALLRVGEKPDFGMQAIVWPEPYCMAKTNDEDKVIQEFTFDEEGYDQAIAWLNQQSENYIKKGANDIE